MSSHDSMKPALASLARTCEAIANGRFDEVDDLFQVITDMSVEDDIRALAETFSGMVVQVEAREFHSSQLIAELTETKRKLEAAEARLRKENAELKTRLDKFEVTYDKEQAKMEIEEVSDSDYFRSLQSRAKDLRSRYKS
ncbi:hypothetical protein [Roseibium sediminicola]|uniref:Uncharacterized protein n=1 Tax=Roseibium sediminicola TaxID=2933272 RepID=A0ABT0GXG1_9HYPH|nr:hypothetical protein [Roseibium sp. CAU 1639]MCK7614006.1 hypothetical protein [Roseibium sp. CAU 1639]